MPLITILLVCGDGIYLGQGAAGKILHDIPVIQPTWRDSLPTTQSSSNFEQFGKKHFLERILSVNTDSLNRLFCTKINLGINVILSCSFHLAAFAQ